MVEPQSAIQGEAPDRPLVLHIHTKLADCAIPTARRRDLRQLVGHAVAEPVRRHRNRRRRPGADGASSLADAHLQRVRTGDVRRRPMDLVDIGLISSTPARPAVGEARKQAGLVDNLDHVGLVLVRLGVREAHPPRFEEEAARHRGSPAPHGQVLVRKLVMTERIGREVRPAVLPEAVLNVIVEVDLVPAGGLERQADVGGVVGRAEQGLSAVVRDVGPGVGLSGVQVLIHAGQVVLVRLPADPCVEPQPVAQDGTADSGIDVGTAWRAHWATSAHDRADPA